EEDGFDREEVAGDDAGRLRFQELAPTRAAATRRRFQTGASEKPPDARRRDDEAELAQLATDPAMTPARVLARKPEHLLPHLRWKRRTPDATGRLAPSPPHQRLMPPQPCPRPHQQHGSRRAREMNGCSDQECSIRHPELRPSNLATQNLELVPQHQQLNVLHVQAAAAPNKRTQESPKREVEKREGHAADPPNP